MVRLFRSEIVGKNPSKRHNWSNSFLSNYSLFKKKKQKQNNFLIRKTIVKLIFLNPGKIKTHIIAFWKILSVS